MGWLGLCKKRCCVVRGTGDLGNVAFSRLRVDSL